MDADCPHDGEQEPCRKRPPIDLYRNRTLGLWQAHFGYFGGYIKPANHKENRRDRRLSRNQNGKRQCVVVIRERDGAVLPAAFRS